LGYKYIAPLHSSPATHQAKPTKFIDDNSSLQQALQELKEHDTLAFDLEFDSHRNAYGVNLCLIQVAAPTMCYVIDPIAGIGLDGLYALFEDPSIQKIVHSPGEDLRLLHSLGCYPQNVFDTEVVAKLLNYEQTSLSSMLQAKLGYSLDKGQQRSNWLRRPLTPEQIKYAAEDVTGLHELKQLLLDEAYPKSLLPFIEEEQAALTTTIHVSERKESFLKQGDLANLSPYDQYVLNGLFLFRDELARSLNRPAFQVMDETIVRSLASGEMYPEDLVNAKGVYGGYKNTRFANQLGDKLDDFHTEAERQNLSKTRPPRQYNGDGRTSRSLMADQKEALFTPIQQALAQRFGEFAGRFILSNGTVNDILKGTQPISSLKRQYKQDLIKSIAQDQGIDLTPYL
jgi:ribonuclease D